MTQSIPGRLRRAALLAALLPAPLAAQATAGAAAGVGSYLETYDFLPARDIGVRHLSLLTLPFAARLPLAGRVDVELRGAYARGSMERSDGGSVEISGPTDTELLASVAVLPERLTVSAGVLLPTGNARQTEEEAQLAGLVAADLLPFRISNWGAGGGGGASTTLTLPYGEGAVGISAGYTVGREYTPLSDDDFSYRPGNEARVRVAVDRSFGSAGKASLVVGMRHYSQDAVSGENAYAPGSRVEALASYAFAAGPGSSGAVYAGVQHRAEGRFAAADLDAPAQDLLLGGGGVRLPLRSATLVPSAEGRLFRRADGLGQGGLGSAGASLEIPTASVTLVPSLRARFGRVRLWEGAESAVRGVEIGLGVRYSR